MVDAITTSEKPAASVQASSSTRIICRVCQKQFSLYTCPRCNSRYCSLHCYKAHSLRCTESFMRENVMEELQQIRPDDEIKKKMLNILKRFHSGEEMMDPVDEDDGDSVLSEETMRKILSGNEVSLDDLSVEEMKQFQRAIASGELGKLIEPWEPWWLKPLAKTVSLSREGTRLVHTVNPQDTAVPPQDILESGPLSEVPAGPENPLVPVNKLSSTQPSPMLAIHLVDIIYSYCFTLRLYNGDWHSDALGAALVVFSVSSILGEGGQPEILSEALAHCLEQTCSPAYRDKGGLQFGLGLIDDTVSLLNLGRSALVCLLCELQRLIQAASQDPEFERGKKLKRSDVKRKLKLADKKVYFLMCWVHEQPSEAWSSLASIIELEKKSMILMDHGTGRKLMQVNGRGEPKGKILIEEVE